MSPGERQCSIQVRESPAMVAMPQHRDYESRNAFLNRNFFGKLCHNSRNDMAWCQCELINAFLNCFSGWNFARKPDIYEAIPPCEEFYGRPMFYSDRIPSRILRIWMASPYCECTCKQKSTISRNFAKK